MRKNICGNTDDMEDSKETRSSKQKRTSPHLNAWRLWQYTQFLYGWKSDGLPALREENSCPNRNTETISK